MRLNFIQERISLLYKSDDFADRGKQLVEERRVRLGPFEAVPYCLDWEQDPVKNRSWQWRWGNLSLLAYLITYHARSGDDRALEMGIELITNWSDNFFHTMPGDAGLNEFVWHDHGTALRAEHILWFYYHIIALDRWDEFSSVIGVMLQTLEKLGTILERDEFYSEHTNHGLEQSRILLLLGTASSAIWPQATQWRRKALGRLKSELDFAFTEEGVHVENSPGYHIFVFKVFISIVQEYRADELEDLAEIFSQKSRLILDFITHILRPDGLTPIIGDTEKLRPTDSFRRLLGNTDEYKNFLYSHSRGALGIRPTTTHKVYPKSGYAIYRNTWATSKDHKNSMHAIFKAGASSLYHRQQDEGSVVLYAFGEDWLIDGGMYNYNNADPIRKYMRSRRAHNVVLVDNARYAPWDVLKTAWSLSELPTAKGHCIIDSTFDGFEGLSLRRRIEFENSTMTVTDEITCEDSTPRAIQLLWHVDSSKTVETESEGKIQICSSSSNRRLIITTDSNMPVKTNVKTGQSNNRINAVTSDKANKFEPAKVIEVNCELSREHRVVSRFAFA